MLRSPSPYTHRFESTEFDLNSLIKCAYYWCISQYLDFLVIDTFSNTYFNISSIRSLLKNFVLSLAQAVLVDSLLLVVADGVSSLSGSTESTLAADSLSFYGKAVCKDLIENERSEDFGGAFMIWSMKQLAGSGSDIAIPGRQESCQRDFGRSYSISGLMKLIR